MRNTDAGNSILMLLSLRGIIKQYFWYICLILSLGIAHILFALSRTIHCLSKISTELGNLYQIGDRLIFAGGRLIISVTIFEFFGQKCI